MRAAEIGASICLTLSVGCDRLGDAAPEPAEQPIATKATESPEPSPAAAVPAAGDSSRPDAPRPAPTNVETPEPTQNEIHAAEAAQADDDDGNRGWFAALKGDSDAPTTEPPAAFHAEARDGTKLILDPDQPLVRRAGAPKQFARGVDLRDPATVARRLGLSPVRKSRPRQLAIKAGGKSALRVQGDERSAIVALYLTTADVTTAAGVAVGSTIDDVIAANPKPACVAEGSADGENFYCSADSGFVARFPSKSKRFDELDNGTTLSIAQARREIGRAKVSQIVLWAQDTPEPRPASTVPTPTTAPASTTSATGPLPASLDGLTDTYSICDQDDAPVRCLTPVAAVYTADDLSQASAQKHLASVDTTGLAAGYPMAVHTDQLALSHNAHDGVVSVIGLFHSEAAAVAWRDKHRPKAQVDTLGPPSKNSPETRYVAITLRPGGKVSVFDSPRLGTPTMPSAGAKKICSVEGGSIFVTTQALAHKNIYESVPVTCDDGKVEGFVPWTDALLNATFGESESGQTYRWQLREAVCDSPRFSRWKVDGRGHTIGSPRLTARPSC